MILCCLFQGCIPLQGCQVNELTANPDEPGRHLFEIVPGKIHAPPRLTHTCPPLPPTAKTPGIWMLFCIHAAGSAISQGLVSVLVSVISRPQSWYLCYASSSSSVQVSSCEKYKVNGKLNCLSIMLDSCVPVDVKTITELWLRLNAVVRLTSRGPHERFCSADATLIFQVCLEVYISRYV